LKSFYVSSGYYTENTVLKAIVFSGYEKTYQAWNGVPSELLKTNRTYNSAGEYTDENGTVNITTIRLTITSKIIFNSIFRTVLIKTSV
jgi:hypothetical protein